MTLWTRLRRWRRTRTEHREHYEHEAARHINRQLHDAFRRLGPPPGWAERAKD